MKTFVIAFGFILLVSVGFAQTSVLQDKSGESSLIINSNYSVFVNSGATSIGAGYSLAKVDTGKEERCWGTNIKFKANNGSSTIISGYDFKAQFDFSLYRVWYLKSNAAYNFIYSSLAASHSNFNLLKTDNSNSFNSDQFWGYKLTLGYNRLSAIGKIPWLDGISISYGLINNLNDLKSVQTYSTSTVTTNDSQTTLLQNQQTGYSGVYFKTNIIQVNFDEYIYPLRQIGVGGYLRSQLTGNMPRNNAGAGVVLGKKGAPDNVVFGILYQFNDIFNQLNKQNDFLKRGGIYIVAGYSF